MIRTTFTILFYIKRTKVLKDGTVPIYVRITVNGQRSEFGFKRSVVASEWDSAKERVKGFSKNAKKINSYIDFVKSELYSVKHEMEEYGKVITATSLKNKYLGIDEDQKTILEIFKEHNDRCKSRTRH